MPDQLRVKRPSCATLTCCLPKYSRFAEPWPTRRNLTNKCSRTQSSNGNSDCSDPSEPDASRPSALDNSVVCCGAARRALAQEQLVECEQRAASIHVSVSRDVAKLSAETQTTAMQQKRLDRADNRVAQDGDLVRKVLELEEQIQAQTAKAEELQDDLDEAQADKEDLGRRLEESEVHSHH